MNGKQKLYFDYDLEVYAPMVLSVFQLYAFYEKH